MYEPLLVWAQMACALLGLNMYMYVPVVVGTRELASRSVNVCMDVGVCASGQTHVHIDAYVHRRVPLWV